MGLIVCGAALAGCASTHDKGQVQQVLPPNAESEYLKTVAVSISLNGNVTPIEISYAITLKVRKPLPESAIAVLKFENPDPRAAPVEVVYEPKPDQKEIFVISPSVACIVNGRHYRVVVTLFADRERRDILGTHEQMVAFFAPAVMLKTLRVPECRPTEQNGAKGDLREKLEVQSPPPRQYLPPGSPDPGPACKREVRPKWLEFFCHFMTKDLWVASGSPKFQASAGQPEWIPFFDTNSGLIEGLAPIVSDGGSIKRRYTPWSRFFKEEMHCEKNQSIDPSVFRYAQNLRRHLIGLNWEEVIKDPSDPTSGFEEEAMFMLFALADFKRSYKERETAPLRTILFSIASGESTFQPDYQRDGEVSFVKPDGTVILFDDLDLAAKLINETGWLATNDLMQTRDDSLQEAKFLSSLKARPLVHIYLAQDILTLPWANNTTYQKRLEYLIKKAVALSGQTRKIAAMSHGWSAHIVASTVMPYPDVMQHISIGPSPGPWNLSEFLHVLRNSKVETRILMGRSDFVSMLGSGGGYGSTEMRACVPTEEEP
jgi:hypothetical protein